MTDEHDHNLYTRAEAIFLNAIELQEDHRLGFIEEQCANDVELRGAVESLLRAHLDDSDDWDAPRDRTEPLRDDGAQPAVEFQPGEVLGRYEIVRRISSGGMGTVYEATQDVPRRTVALKILRREVMSETILKRFEYESQILAKLRHPNIAQVYDAGTIENDSGRIPFIAMEYIPNALSLIDYANRMKLDTRQRLQLFTSVCDAVQHAHAKGVIHRDLKPANILVEATGADEPRAPTTAGADAGGTRASQSSPKIIDFGIARITDQDVVDITQQTTVGQIIGTLSYMSPEQCRANPDELDTRSDVYALGVVLYELLTGRLPYAINRRVMHEAMRVIQEDPPAQLSTISRNYRGDLETIVGKALEKEKSRRYQTANDLAADVTRYLHDEPIIARPPSAMYQMRKFAKRHTAMVASTAIIFVLLISAVSIITPLYIVSDRARKEAEAARTDANLELDRHEAVIDFLTTMIESADPIQTKGENITVKEMLDAAAGDVERELGEQPLVRASVEHAIGWAYQTLGTNDAAREHLRNAVELHREHGQSRPLRFIDILTSAASSARTQGRFEDAVALLDEAENVLVTRRDSIDQSREQDVRAAEVKILYQRGILAAYQWDLETALSRFEKAHALLMTIEDPEPTALATVAEGLANIYSLQQDFENSRTWYERAIAYEINANGEDSPAAAMTRANLATLLAEEGFIDEAEELILLAIDTIRRVYGERHLNMVTALSILADVHVARGRRDEAIATYQQAVEIDRAAGGQHHPDHAVTLFRYGYGMLQLGEIERARDLFHQAVDYAYETDDAGHEMGVAVIETITNACIALEQFDLCESIWLGQQQADDDARRDAIIAALITLYEAWGKPEQAQALRAGSSH